MNRKKQTVFNTTTSSQSAYTKDPLNGSERTVLSPSQQVNTLPDILDTEKRHEAIKAISQQEVSIDGRKQIVQAQVEGAKEQVKAQQQNEEKLDQLLSQSTHVLYKLVTVFPFDFFTDEISIGPSQIDICIRTFFMTKQMHSIPIKNIADVFIHTSLFFASLKIIDSSFIENSVTISYLKKHEAIRARDIIQGLVIASKEGIDITKVPEDVLLEKIEIIGKQRGMNTKKSE
jgi:hypothetical protein